MCPGVKPVIVLLLFGPFFDQGDETRAGYPGIGADRGRPLTAVDARPDNPGDRGHGLRILMEPRSLTADEEHQRTRRSLLNQRLWCGHRVRLAGTHVRFAFLERRKLVTRQLPRAER